MGRALGKALGKALGPGRAVDKVLHLTKSYSIRSNAEAPGDKGRLCLYHKTGYIDLVVVLGHYNPMSKDFSTAVPPVPSSIDNSLGAFNG